MLSWFKKRQNVDKAKQAAAGAQIAIRRMGQLIEWGSLLKSILVQS